MMNNILCGGELYNMAGICNLMFRACCNCPLAAQNKQVPNERQSSVLKSMISLMRTYRHFFSEQVVMTCYVTLFKQLSKSEKNQNLFWQFFAPTQLLMSWKRNGEGRMLDWDKYLDDAFCKCILADNVPAQVIQFLMGVSLQRALVIAKEGPADSVVCNSIWNSSNVIRRISFLTMGVENELTRWWKDILSKLQEVARTEESITNK
jgi:hypothetical protein